MKSRVHHTESLTQFKDQELLMRGEGGRGETAAEAAKVWKDFCAADQR